MKAFIVYILLLAGGIAIAQNKQLLYGLEEVPQSLLLNPSIEVSQRFHISVPLLSHLHVNAGTSGITVYDIFKNDGVDINTKIENAIFSASSKDFFTATQQLELLNIGWYDEEKKMYFSGGWYQEMDAIAYFPKDFAILATQGNRDFINVPFNFSDISASADLLSVLHFGANKKLSKKLIVGARAKLYSSILSISSKRNSGTFTTRPSENGLNVYEHIINDVDINVHTSGVQSLNNKSSGQVVGALLGRTLFSGNYGVGLDIGATYHVTDKLTASASLLDIGGILHTSDTESYTASGSYTLNGIELIFPPIEAGQQTFPYYDNLEAEIEEAIPVDTTNVSYINLRPLKFNGQLAYNFGKYSGDSKKCNCLDKSTRLTRVNEAGVHVFSVFRPKGPQFAGTLFYRRRIGKWLSLKGTYTIDAYSAKNLGAAIVADIWRVNFYLAADNLLGYENIADTNSVSLQLGLNIKLPKR